MNLGFKKLPIFLSTIFLAGSCLIFMFFYRGIDKNIQAAEKLESEWQTEVSRRQEMKNLDNTVKIIEEEKKELDRHFSNSSNVVPFLNTLEELSRNVGAEAQVSSVDILKDNQGLSVGVKAVGSFESLYKLLLLFENSPYEIEIESVDFNKVVLGDTDTSTYFRWESHYKLRVISFLP